MKEDNQDKEINIGLKNITKYSIIVFIGILLSKVFTYFYRVAIARYFGPEIYGIFSLALMILGFFIAVSSLGLTDGLARFLPFYRGRKQINRIRYLFRILTIILFFSSTISAILLFTLSNFISINIFHNENMIIFLKIFSVLIPLTIFLNIFLNVIRSFEKIGWYSFIWNILQNIVKLAALIILIILGIKTNAIIFSYVLGILAMLLVSYFLCKYKLSEIFGRYQLGKNEKTKVIKEVFSYSWPIMFSGLINSIFYWIDSSLLGYFMEMSDVGIYNAATPIIAFMAFAPAIFSQLFFPLITREFSKKNYKVIKELSKQVGKWICILNLPVFLLIFSFPGAIINLFFGIEYISAAIPLRILAIGGFISSLVYLSTDLISVAGKSKIILTNIIVASLLNIFLNVLLIPRYGLNGAAFATMIVWILLSVALLFEVKYCFSIIPLKKKILKIFLLSLIPLLLLLFIRQFITINIISLILFGIFFILCYFFLIFITGCFDKNDIMILKIIKGKISPLIKR